MHFSSAWGPGIVSGFVLGIFCLIAALLMYALYERHKSLKELLTGYATVLAVAAGVLYTSHPQFLNWVLYQGIYAHMGQVIFIGAGITFGSLAFKYAKEEKWNLTVLHGLVTLMCAVGGFVFVAECNNLRTYELHPFTERALVEVQPDQVLWTPPQVAHRAIDGTFNSSKYMVSEDYIEGIPYKGGVGYVNPTSPDGLVNTWVANCDGYVIFDDRHNADPDNNVVPIKDEQPVGVDMEWSDNIWYALYHDDFSAVYSDYKLLSLDPENPNQLTAVCPKIEYRYHMKWFIPVAVPEWAGLTLVQKNAKGWQFEHVTVEQAKSESRFKRQPIFPKSLAKRYTEVQVYDQGIIGAWVNREGKIQVPELPGAQQYPHFLPADAETSYYQTLVEPWGNSGGLNGVFYVNTHTGERTKHMFPQELRLTGPLTGLDLCKNIRGYAWYEKSGDKASGSMLVMKPVLLTRKGRVYFKYTITNTEFQGISATPVIDARTRKIEHVFQDRDTFLRWYRGDDVDTSTEGVAEAKLIQLEQLLNKALSEVNSVRTAISPEKN